MQPTLHQSSPERPARSRARNTRSAASVRGTAARATIPISVHSRRLRMRRKLNKWEWMGFGLSVVACISLWPLVMAARGNMAQVSVQVEEKQAQLSALERQRDEEKGRLAHLKSEKGREQLLVERGYLKPGDRFLLFPEATPKP